MGISRSRRTGTGYGSKDSSVTTLHTGISPSTTLHTGISHTGNLNTIGGGGPGGPGEALNSKQFHNGTGNNLSANNLNLSNQNDVFNSLINSSTRKSAAVNNNLVNGGKTNGSASSLVSADVFSRNLEAATKANKGLQQQSLGIKNSARFSTTSLSRPEGDKGLDRKSNLNLNQGANTSNSNHLNQNQDINQEKSTPEVPEKDQTRFVHHDQGGIMIYIDEKNWLKVALETERGSELSPPLLLIERLLLLPFNCFEEELPLFSCEPSFSFRFGVDCKKFGLLVSGVKFDLGLAVTLGS